MTNSTSQGAASRLLAMDTSSSAMTVTLLEGETMLADKVFTAERNHSIYLVPIIQDMLKGCGLKPDELTGFGVGLGPGSYTGVRIGVTVAKTMAWALQIPVVGVSSLEALALGAVEKFTMGGAEAEKAPVWVVPMQNARRGQAFTALFAANGKSWTRLAEDGIRMADSWLDQLIIQAEQAAERPGFIVLTGETEFFEGVAQAFAQAWSGETSVFPWTIRAYEIGRLAAGRFSRGEQDDPHELAPNYTQLAEAQVRLLAKQGGAAWKKEC